MRRMLLIAVAASLVFGLGGAWAEEVSGKVQAVNPTERVVVLQDGTQLWLAEGVPMDTVKEGASVKATYEERDGKKVVTSIEVSGE